MSLPLAGQCQCGKVGYELAAQPYVTYTCHCKACRRLTSSAFTLCAQVPAESLAITLGAPKQRTRIAESGNELTTSFCGQCGSALFAQNSARPRIKTIFAGTLDEDSELTLSAHIWVQQKLPWVVLPAEHRLFDTHGDWRADYAADPTRYQPS
ncbi:MAG: GFA family protein [Burkholderiaceae bacterium]